MDNEQIVGRIARRAAWRVALAYLVLASAWILFSDLALVRVIGELPEFAGLSLIKGIAFVLVTTAMLYLFVSRYFRPFAVSVARKHTEQRLNEAEERYRALFERSLDCVFLADLRGNFLDANRAALDLLGYGREEISSISFHTLLDAGKLPRAFAAVEEIVRTGSHKELLEFQLRRKDGGTVIVETKAALVYQDGLPSAVLGIARDITERRHLESALMAQEQRLRDIVEHSTNLFYSHTPDHVLTYVSPQSQQFFDCDPDEARIRWTEFLTDNPVNRLGIEATQRAIDTAVAQPPYELELITKLRRRVWVQVHEAPIVRDGKTVAIVGALTDVTKRKQNEARITRLTQLKGALSDINRTIVQATEENALFADVCAIAVRHAHFVLTWIGILDHASGAVLPLNSAGRTAGIEYLGRIRVSIRDEPEGRGATGTAIREKRTIINNHFLESKRNAPWHEAARAAGIRSSAAIPLRRSGEIVAVLNVYADAPGYFDDEIRDLLEEMASDVSFALDVIAADQERLARLERMRRQLEAIGSVSASDALLAGDVQGFAREVTEQAALALGVERANIWLFNDDETELRCIDLFEATPARHSAGPVLKEEQFRNEFEALKSARYVDADEPLTDPRTAGYAESYLKPLRITSMLDAVVQIADRRLGLLCLEHVNRPHHWEQDEIAFACQLADKTGLAITQRNRRRAQAELAESESRFRAMIDQSISGISIVQDGKIVYMNPRCARIFGYSRPEQLIGLDPLETVAPRDRVMASESMRRVYTGEVPSEAVTFTGLRKDGSEVDIGIHAAHAAHIGKPAIISVMQDISERKRAEEEVKRYVARLEQAMQSTINAVATIGELRDPYTHGHERRVGEIATAIAEEMGLSAAQTEGIRIAGYLHDIGKIGVPAEILAKPGKLTKAEYDLVKDHAQQSYEILKTVEFPWPVAEAAWQHHERLDGSGYPCGLKGDQIIPEARILAVADVVEAMSSHRPYRPGLGIEMALAEIEKNRGRFYCPHAADACLRLFRGKGYLLPA